MLVLSGFAFKANANYVFDSRCLDAYNAIFDFRLNDARAIIQQEKKLSPDNGITILLDNYIDYITLLTSDNKHDYDILKDRKSDRVDQLENLEDDSPYYLFAQAEVYLQWGMVKGKFGDYTSSAYDMKKARSLLRENAKKYPDFLPNQKSLGIIDVVFGALPSNLKTLAKFLGMDGNSPNGVATLERLRSQIGNSKYSFYNDEVIFYLCYSDIDVLHNHNNYDKLLGYIGGLNNKGFLKNYLKGYVAAKTGHDDEAISNFLAIPHSNQYLTLPMVDYLLGCAKLCRMDSDAYRYLLKYIDEYKGMNFIKDAYLKVAYFYLLRNDEDKYNYYLKLVRSRGYTNDEKDKQALKEANDARPDNDLLKARLYFDGGYYDKTLAQLHDKKETDFSNLRDKLLLSYYRGRANEKLSKYNPAISDYQHVIDIGKNSTYYYAANAALSIGNIYEFIKDYNLAAAYYHLAMNMKNHEYQSSIENEAKISLDRIHR